MPQKYGRAQLFLTSGFTKLNPLRSLFSYITIKYITLTLSAKADGGDFHYPDNVNSQRLCLKSI
jgi:hypothetical protein